MTPWSTRSIASRHTAAVMRPTTLPRIGFFTRIGTRPIALSQPRTSSINIRSVCGPGTTSTKGINSGGLRGWTIMHRSGRVARATSSFAVTVADELETTRASGATASKDSTSFCLAFTSSWMASMIH